MLSQTELGKRSASRTEPGTSFPIGATLIDGGVNFSIFSVHATSIELLLFSDANDSAPQETIVLDPQTNKTHDFWHVFIPGLMPGQVYAYRAHGPYRPEHGLRFDSDKVLLDPYTKAVVGWDNYNRDAAAATGDNCAQALRSAVVESSDYDWGDDRAPRTPLAETIIYEMHVGGFTRNPNSGVPENKRGTFAGLIEKIPYLKDLGVTAVELMPVHQFDEHDLANGRINYWGYQTVAFFAPHHRYCVGADPVAGVTEFKDMVKALHKAGIEVILDVVFNHTAEGGETGPMQCLKGIDNSIYYISDPNNRSGYANFTGCGNSFNANHPVAGRLILDSLRYWVSEMHVDGFRFDLAAALARDVWGDPMPRPPLLWCIDSDPVLAGSKMIAEAWDAAGLYKVGWFVTAGEWYAEWNGPFRDDVRRFIKGERGMVKLLANRLLASSDLYTRLDREPNRSINFLTCHDGFTLNDLVSYNEKHNEANLENNRDGADANFSWNCGHEGQTSDPEIQKLRERQMRNLLTVLFMSQGTPMVLMGDEIQRSQNGNNNGYCQDNQGFWFDWNDVQRNAGMHRFSKMLIEFTQKLDVFRQTKLVTFGGGEHSPSVSWHGVNLGAPDWGEDSHSLAFTLDHPFACEHLHVMFNAFWEPLEFELPQLPKPLSWSRIVDTNLPSPQDICSRSDAPLVQSSVYSVMPRSSVVLLAR